MRYYLLLFVAIVFMLTSCVSQESKEDIVELTPEFIKKIEQYDMIGRFSEGYAAVEKDGKWGYINTKGDVVIPVTHKADCAGRFSEGLAFIYTQENYNFYVIDKEGNTIFHGEKVAYDDDGGFVNADMLPFYVDGRMYVPIGTTESGFHYSIYDKSGNVVGEKVMHGEEADSITLPEGGEYIRFTKVSNGRYGPDVKLGLKDASGKVVVPAVYDIINKWLGSDPNGTRTDFSNGVVLVVLISEEIYDRDGQVLKKPGEFVEDDCLTEGAFFYYGYADMKGNDTFSPELKARIQKQKEK